MINLPKEQFDSKSSDKLDAVAERYETQSDKFKKAARDLEADESEANWELRLKKAVKLSPKDDKRS